LKIDQLAELSSLPQFSDTGAKFLMIRVISNILEMATCITDSILESLVLYFTLLNQIVSFLFICEEYVLILAVIFHVFQRNQSIFRLLIFTEF